MEYISFLVDLFLHLDKHLGQLIQTYGTLTYTILFLVVFLETGLVITPFLPGDSLLFTAGAFAAKGDLNLSLLLVILFIAPLVGDQSNYWVGRLLGRKLPFSENSKIFKKKYLIKTEEFYSKYGTKTVILARFIPIVRTFAPFVAGMGKMPYLTFVIYSTLGAGIWVGICVLAGYFFGNAQIVKENFSLVVIAIIFISVLPVGLEWYKNKNKK